VKTPLHCASEWSHLNVTQFLIEHGADPAAQDNDGWTPLYLASKLCHRHLAQVFAEYGADPAVQEAVSRFYYIGPPIWVI
jgi:ankyrin repeat protein